MFIKDIFFDWDSVSEESYLKSIEAFRGLERISFHKSVTFFVGENGSGKSTLLEAMAIADGFNPEGGTKNYSFSTYDSHSELCEAVRLSRIGRAKWGYFLRAESFYNVATKEEEYGRESMGGSLNLHKQSHGESFLTMFQNNFNGRGLFFLDEPEAALSPQRQLTLLVELDRCRKQGAQFFIVTHSPILLGLPEAEILSFDRGTIHPCAYEDTDSYRITDMFLNDRARILKELLDEDME